MLPKEIKKEILDCLLNISEIELDEIYKILHSGKIVQPLNVTYLKEGFSKWGKDDSCDSFQIDLPFMNNYDPLKRSIMIVGLDAKRESVSDIIPKDLILSSPFFLHTEEGKNTRKNQYWDIISLLTGSYNIYTTDLYKLYFHRKDLNGKITLSNQIQEGYTKLTMHKSILEKEIKAINPVLILCFGDKARKECANILKIRLNGKISKENIINGYNADLNGSKCKFIAIPHPSGLTRNNHWQAFFKSNKIEENIDYLNRPKVIAKLIENALRS